MPGSLLDDINAQREAEGFETLRRRRSLLQRTGSFARAFGRSAVDAPLNLVESAGRVGEDIDRRLEHLFGGETPEEAEQRLPTFARKPGDRVRDAEGALDITGGVAKLRRANRRLWGGSDDQSGEALAGDITGSIIGMGGIYRRAGTAAQGLLRNSGRLAPLANTTTFWGSRAREALAGAPLTALMELPDKETSSSYALGTLLDDTKYGDPIGEALLGASESPLGRVATGVGLDMVGDIVVSGALERGLPALRGTNRRQPRLANPTEELVAPAAPPVVDDVIDQAAPLPPVAPAEPRFLDPDDPFFRSSAEAEAEGELDRLFAQGRRAPARAGDPLEDLRAAEEAYAAGAPAVDDPIAAAMLDDGTPPGWLEQIDRASNVVEVGPGTTTFPRRPADLNRPLPPEGDPRRRLVSPNSQAVDVGEESLPFNVRPRTPQDFPARNAPMPEDFAELDEIERALLEGDEWRNVLEQIDTSSRMNPTDDVRVSPEEQAAVRGRQVLNVPTADPFVRPFAEPEPGPGARTLPGPPAPRTLPDKEIAERIHSAAARIRDAVSAGNFDRYEMGSLRMQLRSLQQEWARRGNEMLEEVDRLSRMPVVDDVRVSPEEQAAVRGRQTLTVSTSEPFTPELRPRGERKLLAVPRGEEQALADAARPDSPVGSSAPEGTTAGQTQEGTELPGGDQTPTPPVSQQGEEVLGGEQSGVPVPVQPAGEGAVAEEAARALEVADQAVDASPVSLEEAESVAQQAEAAEPVIRKPQEYAVGETLDMPEGTRYVRTAKGFRVVGSTGGPKGRTIPLGEMEVKLREVGDPIYREHRQRARGVKSDAVLVERALSLARRAARGATEGAEYTPLMRREAQAFADEVAERGLDVGDAAPLIDELRAIDQTGLPPEARVRTATGIALNNSMGFVQVGLARTLAGGGVGAALGAAVDQDNPLRGALAGGLIGAGLSTGYGPWKGGAAREIDLTKTRVLDGTGKPKVVYHGTGNGFQSFTDVPDKDADFLLFGPSYYFTEDPAVASTYAKGSIHDRIAETEAKIEKYRAWIANNPQDPKVETAREVLKQEEYSLGYLRQQPDTGGANVRPARLMIERPYDIDQAVDQGEVDRLFKLAGAEGSEYRRRVTDGARNEDVYNALWAALGNKAKVNRVLQAAGYDGITHIGGNRMGDVEHRVWIAFDRKQVRSAFGPADKAAQAGFTRMGVIHSVLGAGVGGTAGAAADDDNPLRGFLVGAALGVGVPAAGRRVADGLSFSPPEQMKSVRDFLRRNFTSTGDLPKPVFDAKIRGHGWIESQVREVSYTVRDFERAAKDAYGGVDRMTDTEIDAVDKALKGQVDLADLPEPMRPVVQRMRAHVDALSRRLIDDGIVQGPLAATIESGLGFYAKRSYRIFDDPDWAKSVPEDVKNRAIAYLRSEYPTSSEEEIQGVLAELLFRGEQSPIAMIQKRRLGSKAMDTLKKRDDIHPTIRALWGEYGEASINYAKSVGSMAQIVGNHQILISARDAGMGKWLFDQPIVRDGEQYAVQIAADGSKAMAPLNGLYTTPAIRDAFEQAFESTTSGALLRAYMKANGAVKFAKTVASPQSQIRNLVGNTGFAVANGHVRGAKMVEAFRTVLTDLTGRDYQQFRDKYKRLLELGVVGSGTTEGELRDLVKEASKQGVGYLTSPPVTAGQKLLKGATAAYRASDDLWKVFAFENEVARYQEAFPNRPRQEIEALAAEVVRNTYPNYEMVPNAVKMLRRVPLVGTFVSFPAEVVRVGYNTIGQAAKELGDPATRRIGLQRAAGILAAATLTSAIGVATRQVVGVTPEEEEDMRRFLPSWNKHAQFFHLGKDERGNRRFVNVGYTDPYSYLKEPVIALLSGEDWEKKLAESAWMLAEPFFGEELLAGRLIDISRNKKKESGGTIYNEQAPLPDRVADQLAYVAEAFEPGILTSGKRMYKGATGEMSPSGRVYDLGDEVISFATGQRREAVDVRQSLRFKARDYQKAVTDANRIINSTITDRGRVTESEIREGYDDTETARRRLFDTMHRDVLAAVRLGMEPAEAYAMLRQSGVSKDMGRMLLLGQYQPYKPSKQFLKSVGGSVAVGAASPEEREKGLTDLRMRIGVLRQAYQDEVLEARRPKED